MPQLQVTWPWPTRGIFVGLPLEFPRPELFVVKLGNLEGNEGVGVVTGRLCCCPYIVLAAAIAARAAGGKSP